MRKQPAGKLPVAPYPPMSAAGLNGITGRVRQVSPRVDPQTRLGSVRVFIGPDPRIRVGTFATGIVETARSKDLAVPSSAVMRDSSGPYVHIVNTANTIETRRLKIGLTSAGFIEVLDGIELQDRIVAKAGTFLGAGERVAPIEIPETKQRPEQAKAG